METSEEFIKPSEPVFRFRRCGFLIGTAGQGRPDASWEGSRMKHRLRLYTGEDAATTLAEPEVTVSLGEIAQILTDASHGRRAWLRDFADDQVRISADLHEVLQTYWNLRPGA
jgi:hypothetical protein